MELKMIENRSLLCEVATSLAGELYNLSLVNSKQKDMLLKLQANVFFLKEEIALCDSDAKMKILEEHLEKIRKFVSEVQNG